ncbi:ogr/Delta-like zinc finger family protein [Vibrio vulnificus]|uniref:ogr/Delta-like zinc finger family protein n=1 Tax=Vibrio vulnificus TaxID=672 RepID=UPI0010299BC5|nr:ogr/Delta-like zinc finger family protein [Vibrio vulnificus]RZP89601.1 zinc-binding protein [Vibrio vulnificus]RZR41903.1 zinc-binding protein [Vibrio vulnificus]
MLIVCPHCETKARISSSRPITRETREAYCQCLNMNCGAIFVVHISVARTVTPTREKPCPVLQPELYKPSSRNGK